MNVYTIYYFIIAYMQQTERTKSCGTIHICIYLPESISLSLSLSLSLCLWTHIVNIYDRGYRLLLYYRLIFAPKSVCGRKAGRKNLQPTRGGWALQEMDPWPMLLMQVSLWVRVSLCLPLSPLSFNHIFILVLLFWLMGIGHRQRQGWQSSLRIFDGHGLFRRSEHSEEAQSFLGSEFAQSFPGPTVTEWPGKDTRGALVLEKVDSWFLKLLLSVHMSHHVSSCLYVHQSVPFRDILTDSVCVAFRTEQYVTPLLEELEDLRHELESQQRFGSKRSPRLKVSGYFFFNTVLFFTCLFMATASN